MNKFASVLEKSQTDAVLEEQKLSSVQEGGVLIC